MDRPKEDYSEGSSRRHFLKGAGLVMAGTTMASLLLIPAAPTAAGRESGRVATKTLGKHFAMVMDLRKCIACDACVAACKAENNVPLGVFRTWVEKHEHGRFPDIKLSFVPKLCNQCDDPPCVPVCPVDATFKREDGLVLVDYEECIGCGYCIVACPYGARYFDPVRNVADKCTFCVQRIEEGLEPACEETCVGGARIFGDLDEPDSIVSKIVNTKPVQVLKPSLGTEPQVFYIGLDSEVV